MAIDIDDIKFVLNEYIEKDKRLKATIVGSFLFCVISTVLIVSIIPQTSISTLNKSIELKKQMMDADRERGILETKLSNINNNKVVKEDLKGSIFNSNDPILNYITEVNSKLLNNNIKLKYTISNVPSTSKTINTFRKDINLKINKIGGGPIFGNDVIKVIRVLKDNDKKIKLSRMTVKSVDSKIAIANIEIETVQLEDYDE